MTEPSSSNAPCAIRPAQWPDDTVPATTLLRNYAAYLSSGPNGTVPMNVSGLLKNLDMLAQAYVEPHGTVLLAWVSTEPAGCVAVKPLPDPGRNHEIKRLWIEPRYRGFGLGKSLMQAAILWARTHGSNRLLLDTQPEAMPQALALYRSLGFIETSRYNDNPVPGLLFMELRLD